MLSESSPGSPVALGLADTSCVGSCSGFFREGMSSLSGYVCFCDQIPWLSGLASDEAGCPSSSLGPSSEGSTSSSSFWCGLSPRVISGHGNN